MAKRGMVDRYLLDGAQMGWIEVVGGTIAFLKRRGLDVKDWTTYVGRTFRESWAGFQGAGCDEVMGHLIPLQIEPLGVKVLSSRGSAKQVEVTLTPLPSPAVLRRFGTTPRRFLRDFGITAQDFAAIYDVFKPAAQAAGFTLAHELKGDRHVLKLAKAQRRSKRRK